VGEGWAQRRSEVDVEEDGIFNSTSLISWSLEGNVVPDYEGTPVYSEVFPKPENVDDSSSRNSSHALDSSRPLNTTSPDYQLPEETKNKSHSRDIKSGSRPLQPNLHERGGTIYKREKYGYTNNSRKDKYTTSTESPTPESAPASS